MLAPVLRAESPAWFPDGWRILLAARDTDGATGGLTILDTETGALARIVEGLFLEGPLIAPDGATILYTATLQPQAADNGVWLVGADGTGRRQLPFGGGYRWTPDDWALVRIPAPATGPTDELWRYDPVDGTARPLIAAAQVRFTVVQGDWELSPDGTAIAYRSATDDGIWALRSAL